MQYKGTTMFNQLKASITGMDISDDAKQSINELVDKVEKHTDERFNDVKDSRDTTKAKLKEFETDAKNWKDLGYESVDKAKEALTKGGDINEQLSKDLETAQKETNDLRVLLEETDSKLKLSENSISDMNFNQTILNDNLLDGFDIADPVTRNHVTGLYREKTIQVDGKLYVNDGNGNIAKDLKTGEPLGLDFVTANIKETINPKHLLPTNNGNGGGVPPNQSKGHIEQKIDTSKHTSVEGFMSEAMPQITK